MTVPRAAIVFNATTGSDTAASGLGPATAISGTAAAHTGGSASTTITLTGSPDLSGVQAGDLLWLKTASGRQFSVIASADNSAKTVTVDDSFTIAEASAVNYAIGGKRATWNDADSRNLRSDAKAGWTIETETDQTISSVIKGNAVGDTTSGPIVWRGSSGTRKVLLQTANDNHFGSTGTGNPTLWEFRNLKFSNSNATKTAAIACNLTGPGIFFARDCVFGDATNQLLTAVRRGAGNIPTWTFIDCAVVSCTGAGVDMGSAGPMVFSGCYIANNASHGIAGSSGGMSVYNTLITGNGGDGIKFSTAPTVHTVLAGNTIHGNAGDGIDTSAGVLPNLTILNNNITANGGYGWNPAAAQSGLRTAVDYNNFGTASSSPSTANSSGAVNTIGTMDNDLAVDPQYTSIATADFSVGTNVQAKGFPDATRYIGANQSATRSYVDIGAAQRQEAASGGGGGNRIFGSGIITPLELAG